MPRGLLPGEILVRKKLAEIGVELSERDEWLLWESDPQDFTEAEHREIVELNRRICVATGLTRPPE